MLATRRLLAVSVRRWDRNRAPPKKPFELTDTAAARIKELLARRNDNPSGVRIGVQRRGCNGHTYTMDYEYEPSQKKTSAIVEDKGVRIYLDLDSEFATVGTVMDFETSLTEEKFVFTNAKIKSVCGCEESAMIT
eukprot:TRINITY_DN6453_c0_g1_i1.p2 TRINITY_DN6453_c0_g1~~TRINITY_DN6453_c0_g1_i1.p2  ORF type:complete len:135 (-),score=21.14 TRINITY_DN6453_c0_g1_i1:78-482(-)